jgi:hypothetical protein
MLIAMCHDIDEINDRHLSTFYLLSCGLDFLAVHMIIKKYQTCYYYRIYIKKEHVKDRF